MKQTKAPISPTTSDEQFEIAFKGLIETRDAILFAVNDYGFPASREEERAAIAVGIRPGEIISHLDPEEKNAVSKFSYVKETLQLLPIAEKKLFLGAYSDCFLGCRESEKALGFPTTTNGQQTKFPEGFAKFLREQPEIDNDIGNKKLSKYWSGLSEERKNSLIDSYCTGGDEEANKKACEEIASSYDRSRSKEGLQRLETVMSYALQKSEEQSKKESASFDIPTSTLRMMAAAVGSTLFGSAAAQNSTEFPTPSPSGFPARVPSINPTETPTSPTPAPSRFRQSHLPTAGDPPTGWPTFEDNNPNYGKTGFPTSVPSIASGSLNNTNSSHSNSTNSGSSNNTNDEAATIALSVIAGIMAVGLMAYGVKRWLLPSTSPEKGTSSRVKVPTRDNEL